MILGFKKVLAFSIIIVFVGVGLVYSFNWSLNLKGSTQTKPMAEGVNEQFGLKLTASLEKSVYRLGEPVNVSFAITNTGNQTIKYGISRLGNRFDFRVYNITQESIYQWSWDRAFAWMVDDITLDPGESLTAGQYHSQYYAWLQKFDSHTGSVPVSSGTYYIVGQTGPIIMINGDWDIILATYGKPLVIETAPIEITITAP
jgi:hypothetical protein